MNTCRWKWRKELLIKWYADNFSISLTTSRRIHWESYALTKEKLIPKLRRFSIKLTIGWLPVGIRLHYYGNAIDTCHLCPAQETPQHLFRCAHRIPFFLERHTAFQTFLRQINTPEDLINPLSYGILSWALESTEATIQQRTSSFTTAGLQCFQRQQTTGCERATYGLMDISWSLQIPDPQRQDQGQKWQTSVSVWLIESAYQLWTERNTQRNTPDPTTEIDTAALRETNAQIHHISRLI